MTNSKRIWTWALVVVVLAVILILLGGFGPTKNAPAPASPGAPTYAPQGQLAEGFPQDLVLDPSAELQGSYAINYASSTNQYTATWSSTRSLTDLYALYKTYFQGNGWTISNEMNAYQGTMGLHAEKGTAAAGLSIVDNGTARKITVTYVTQ